MRKGHGSWGEVSYGVAAALEHLVDRCEGTAVPRLDVVVSEPTFDTEVATCHGMVVGRGDLDDPIVLDMQIEVATHTAVRADGPRDFLTLGFPHPGLAQLVLGAEHQRVGGAHRDAVAAVDAGRFGEGSIELGRDPGVETPSGHRDGEVIGGASGREGMYASVRGR